MALFRDRRDAGQQLARHVQHLAGQHPIVMGLPRGGVPVAAEVAHFLGAPLDVLVVRKIGCPWHPELALGAIGEGGIRFLNQRTVAATGVTPDEIDTVTRREAAEVARHLRRYRGERAAPDVRGRTVLLVDDGLATGSTARAAVEVLRGQGAARVVLAVPVGPRDAVDGLRVVADDVICLAEPRNFVAVGQAYDDFTQTTDDDVARLLAAPTDSGTLAGAMTSEPVPADPDVDVRIGGVHLSGRLSIPESAVGLVVFAHGSGSSRLSPRNLAVAQYLNRSGFATLLFDLLTPAEETHRASVFDVGLLGTRLAAVTRWAGQRADAAGLPIGYFGASTGAAAALVAAAELDGEVAAVVSRGGRPDLAGPALPRVTSPTLLIVGGRDETVRHLNESAAEQLRCAHQLVTIPGASHLFEEPGALEQVSRLARDWYHRYLPAQASPGYRITRA
jgi:putative phosphoribosyl transferase